MTGKTLKKMIIALNVLYAKKIYPAYVAKYDSNPGKQIILLVIPNGEG